jgi:hypothetical protein
VSSDSVNRWALIKVNPNPLLKFQAGLLFAIASFEASSSCNVGLLSCVFTTSLEMEFFHRVQIRSGKERRRWETPQVWYFFWQYWGLNSGLHTY